MMAEVLLCTICRFAMEEDDVAIHGARVVCLRCYERLTATEKKMSKGFRREIEDVLKDLP